MTKKYKKPLTPKEMAALSDDQIDTSDIPELDENFWKNAKVSPPRHADTDPLSCRRLELI